MNRIGWELIRINRQSEGSDKEVLHGESELLGIKRNEINLGHKENNLDGIG